MIALSAAARNTVVVARSAACAVCVDLNAFLAAIQPGTDAQAWAIAGA
jgi:hypothetical protein